MEGKSSFESYRREPKALSFEKMQELEAAILSEVGTDGEALSLYDELVSKSVKYAGIRASWLSLSREEKMEADDRRTAAHNAVIIRLNMLSRYLRMTGKSAAWRDELGSEEEDPCNRKAIGDFGCYLAFVRSLCAR